MTHLGVLTLEERADFGSVFVSEHGHTVSLANGYLVVSDRVEVLAKIAEAADAVRSAPRDVWLIQLHVVTVSGSDSIDLGTDAQAAIELAASTTSAAVATAGITATLEAVRRDRSNHVDWEPTFVLTAGQPVRFGDTQKLPIVSRTSSEARDLTSEVVTFIEIGRTADLSVRPLGDGSAVLSVDLSDEQVIELVSGRPRSAGYRFSGQVEVRDCSTVLLGSVRRARETRSKSLGLALLSRASNETETVQIWCRVARVSATTTAAPDAGGGAVELRSSKPDDAPETTPDDAPEIEPLITRLFHQNPVDAPELLPDYTPEKPDDAPEPLLDDAPEKPDDAPENDQNSANYPKYQTSLTRVFDENGL